MYVLCTAGPISAALNEKPIKCMRHGTSNVHVCVCKHLTETPLFCASSHRGWCDGDTRPSPRLNPRPKGNSPSPFSSLRPGNQPETHRRHMLYSLYIDCLWIVTFALYGTQSCQSYERKKRKDRKEKMFCVLVHMELRQHNYLPGWSHSQRQSVSVKPWIFFCLHTDIWTQQI